MLAEDLVAEVEGYGAKLVLMDLLLFSRALSLFAICSISDFSLALLMPEITSPLFVLRCSICMPVMRSLGMGLVSPTFSISELT